MGGKFFKEQVSKHSVPHRKSCLQNRKTGFFFTKYIDYFCPYKLLIRIIIIMSTLTIRNIGPIKEVTLNLNKINVIMGPQSSGKSTIAKIISFCTWLEKGKWHFADKTHSLEDVVKTLKKYHRFSDSYFNADSEFYYEGDRLAFAYNCEQTPTWISNANVTHINNKEYLFEKAIGKDRRNFKVCYIPSERNFVSIVPNLSSYAEEDDNLLDFIKTWYETKRKYTTDSKLSILNLNVTYYNIAEDDNDILVLPNGKELPLKSSSSGLQSIVPLFLIIDRFADKIYKEKKPLSVAEMDELNKQYNELKNKTEDDGANTEHLKTLLDLIISKDYHYSQFIIEEPEQNLFPDTQKELVYYLLEKCKNGGREHRMTLTTHSPYILYALNNCMMGYLVKDKMSEEEQIGLKCKSAIIDPKLVAIWEIEDGLIKNIQDKDGLIKDNYFDTSMRRVMDDYYLMLNYYGNEA